MDRESLLRRAALAAASVLAALAPAAAHALGLLADISVVDRTTGQTLPVVFHQGRHWVAGRPGARYAVRVHNRSGGRVLAVASIDGVNVISGETAATGQSGYVFSAWERYDLTGWRKSAAQVAAFHFTALPDSYAARTGRPDDVGVIGVALFRERPPEVSLAVPRPQPHDRAEGRHDGRRDGPPRQEDKPVRMEAPAAAGAADAAPPMHARAETRLGTGHGPREGSMVAYTTFQRAQDTPDEVVTLHYDSHANLVAMGVIHDAPPLPRPRPFPRQPETGFVPDPPRRW